MIIKTDYALLIEHACDAAMRAYAPYSGIYVGAALLCSNGSIYHGCNIENAASSSTICAERTAFFTAVYDNKRDFTAIAIAGGRMKDDGVIGFEPEFFPCGTCRQVMAEFCNPNSFEIITGTMQTYRIFSLSELYPNIFTVNRDK